MSTKVFIDGSEGTTGLRIFERFQGRDDIEIMCYRDARTMKEESYEKL